VRRWLVLLGRVGCYPVPLWQGRPHKITDYANDRRPMRFLDVEPNPTNRIIRAACRAAAG